MAVHSLSVLEACNIRSLSQEIGLPRTGYQNPGYLFDIMKRVFLVWFLKLTALTQAIWKTV